MRPSWLKSLVAVCVSLFLAVPAHAQPLFGHAESIECATANADIVIVGKLVEFKGAEQAEDRGGRVATIAVEETLKGEHHDRLRVRLDRPVSALAGWKVHACRLLLTAQGDPPTATTVLDLASKELQVLTADFTLLSNAAAVVQGAKVAIRRMPGVKRIDAFSLVAPDEAVAGTTWKKYYGTGGYLLLVVPVDEQLEKRARAYICSTTYRQREEGALALRYFKSDENVARVRALLNDPEWSYVWRAEENQGVEVRAYGVREAAYQTLEYWGVPAERPLTREVVVKLDSVQTVSLSNTKVTNAGLKELARFKNLQNLYLWNTQITDDGLKELAGFTNLRNLYLRGTQVTDAGLKYLARLPNLQYLDLGGAKVTDEGLKELAGFTNLRNLDLKGAEVTAGGIAELRKLRPDLKIQH